jgi:hypothetical protein
VALWNNPHLNLCNGHCINPLDNEVTRQTISELQDVCARIHAILNLGHGQFRHVLGNCVMISDLKPDLASDLDNVMDYKIVLSYNLLCLLSPVERKFCLPRSNQTQLAVTRAMNHLCHIITDTCGGDNKQ